MAAIKIHTPSSWNPSTGRQRSASGMVLPLGVSCQLRPVEVDLAPFARRILFGLVIEVWRLGMTALTARRHPLARTRSPNSTTATKLFPPVPYHFVPGYARAPNEASDPHTADVKPMGVVGPASLKGCTMSPVSR